MKTLVFGATGKAGRVVVRHALQKGHAVVAVARREDRRRPGPRPTEETCWRRTASEAPLPG